MKSLKESDIWSSKRTEAGTAFFTMNGYVSVIFFVFWATDIFLA